MHLISIWWPSKRQVRIKGRNYPPFCLLWFKSVFIYHWPVFNTLATLFNLNLLSQHPILMWISCQLIMFECEVCTKQFNSFHAASQHMNALDHWGLECPECDLITQSEEHLNQHIRSQHQGPYCVDCDRHFQNENNLRQVKYHQLVRPDIHTNPNPALAIQDSSKFKHFMSIL